HLQRLRRLWLGGDWARRQPALAQRRHPVRREEQAAPEQSALPRRLRAVRGGSGGAPSPLYLGWVLPFGLLSSLPLALAYTPVAATTLMSFYLVYYPTILWGARPPLLAP